MGPNSGYKFNRFYLVNQRLSFEITLTKHQSSPASKLFVETVYPETLKPLEFMEYNIFASKTENWRS